jgi:flagellar biosynthetic protein FliR
VPGPSLQLQTPLLVAILLASVRTAAWILIAPPFSTRMIPGSIKAVVAMAIAVAVAPGLTAHVPPLEPAPMAVAVVEQVVIGGALGFVTALLFAAVQAAGDMLDLFGGFSIASAYDPLSATTTSVFGRFYNLLAITLLFVTDGHELVLRGFTNSFKTLPLDGTISLATLGRLLTTGINELLVVSLQIAGPLIAVLFCADVGLGLLSRVAPALNVFSLGFPVKILVTIVLAGISIAALPTAVRSLVDSAVRAVLLVGGG